jgi:uncharacterized protein
MILRRRAVLAAPLALAALSGCVGSPPAQYYRLAVIPGVTRDDVTQQITVRDIGIPGYLDQNNIPSPSGGYEFNSFPNALWAAPLADMLQSVMVQNLAQRLPEATILADGGAIGAPAATLVEINVLRFDPDPSGNIVLNAQIALKSGDRHTTWLIQTFTDEAMPATPGPAAIVAAMSALWARMADKISGMNLDE